MCYCEHNIVCGLYFTLSLSRDSEKEIAPANEFFSFPKSLFQGASKRGSLETTLV